MRDDGEVEEGGLKAGEEELIAGGNVVVGANCSKVVDEVEEGVGGRETGGQTKSFSLKVTPAGNPLAA